MVVPNFSYLFIITITITRLTSRQEVGLAFAKPNYNNGFESWESNYWHNGPRETMNYWKSSEESISLETLPSRREINSHPTNPKNSARCGVDDGTGPIDYRVTGKHWEFMELTYKISKYPRSRLTLGGRTNVDAEIRRAFEIWEEVTPLTFKPGKGKVTFDIRFERRIHGKGDKAFDGLGNALAHAFPPPDGRIHFDDDEHWTSGTSEGSNLFQVAAHEIGHALGLHHSHVKNSLMYKNYTGYKPNFRLHSDDIQGIQSIYGGPPGQESGEDYDVYPDTNSSESEEQLPSLEFEDERDFRSPSSEVDEYSEEQSEDGLESKYSTWAVPDYAYSEKELEGGLQSRYTPSHEYLMPWQWQRPTYGRTSHSGLMFSRRMTPLSFVRIRITS